MSHPNRLGHFRLFDLRVYLDPEMNKKMTVVSPSSLCLFTSSLKYKHCLVTDGTALTLYSIYS